MRLLPSLASALLLVATPTTSAIAQNTDAARPVYSFSPSVLADGLNRLRTEIGHRVMPDIQPELPDVPDRLGHSHFIDPVSIAPSNGLRLSAQALLAGTPTKSARGAMALEAAPGTGDNHSLRPRASLGYDTELGQGWTLSSDLGIQYSGRSDLTLYGDHEATGFSARTLDTAPDADGGYRPFMKLIATFRF